MPLAFPACPEGRAAGAGPQFQPERKGANHEQYRRKEGLGVPAAQPRLQGGGGGRGGRADRGDGAGAVPDAGADRGGPGGVEVGPSRVGGPAGGWRPGLALLGGGADAGGGAVGVSAGDGAGGGAGLAGFGAASSDGRWCEGDKAGGAAQLRVADGAGFDPEAGVQVWTSSPADLLFPARLRQVAGLWPAVAVDSKKADGESPTKSSSRCSTAGSPGVATA